MAARLSFVLQVLMTVVLVWALFAQNYVVFGCLAVAGSYAELVRIRLLAQRALGYARDGSMVVQCSGGARVLKHPHRKAPPMKKITIERYSDAKAGFSGLVEGTRDDGSTWIMWLDEKGSPVMFFPHRDETGAVTGDGVSLS